MEGHAEHSQDFQVSDMDALRLGVPTFGK